MALMLIGLLCNEKNGKNALRLLSVYFVLLRTTITPKITMTMANNDAVA